jgi:prepilin-type N-terminal cleavage/methylation domain-containing protein/prepilin-type processing-associated H-X9-DG protein
MRRAFTLIELLVVIAIIAILAAILFPVFAQAKEAAKKTACLSGAKQIALGLYMYATDSDDTMCQTSWEEEGSGGYPGTYNPANPNGTYQVHWSFLVQPYVKNYQIFVCPSDPNPVKTDNPSCASVGSAPGQLVNGLMVCDWEAPANSYISIYNVMPAHDWTVVSLGSLNTPATQIVVGEHRFDGLVADDHKGTSGFYPSQPCPGWAQVAYPPSGSQYSEFPLSVATTEYAAAQPINGSSTDKTLFKKYDVLRVAWDRHTGGGGANYAFADGHAKYQNIGAVLNPTNYEFGDRWYPNSQPWNSSPCN